MLASTRFAHVGMALKLPWYVQAGMTLHVLPRWRADDALEVVARERVPSLGAVAPPVGAHAALPGGDGRLLAQPGGDRRRTAADGWLRTGDLARIDDRACVVLAGRRSEMYLRGDYNVFPMEVEAVLGDHPAVASVAVVPRPHDTLGEVGVAVVVPTAGSTPPTPEELRAHAVGRLARRREDTVA